MRLQKSFMVLGILLFIGIFITGVANAAPDMSQWEGKWFSYKTVRKGIAFDGANFMKGSDKESGYFKMWEWDPVAEQFQIDVYFLDNGVWKAHTEAIDFFAGNELNFLFVLRNEEEGFAFVALVEGKEKKGILSSAKVTTFGGLVLQAEGNEYRAGNLVFTGTMVDVSKVKVSPGSILH
jgi:hypothetical protein